jgi:hypothetical protein
MAVKINKNWSQAKKNEAKAEARATGQVYGSTWKQIKNRQQKQESQQSQPNASFVADAGMQQQMQNAQQALADEQKRIDAINAENLRQQQIQAENQKSADFRRQAENQAQASLNTAAQNQQRLATQGAGTAVSGSGYNVGSAQQQKISAAGGGVATPSPYQMGIPAAMASNAGVGGTQQYGNRFAIPNMQGLTFGGM